MGADVEEFPDGMRVAGRSAGRCAARRSSRMAIIASRWRFRVAALGAKGETVIRDADCVGVSFPEFFATLERLRGAEVSSG